MHVAKDLRSQEARRAAMRALAEITANRFKGAPPLLDPAEDMGIADADFRKLQRRLEATEGLLADHPLAGSSSLQQPPVCSTEETGAQTGRTHDTWTHT